MMRSIYFNKPRVGPSNNNINGALNKRSQSACVLKGRGSIPLADDSRVVQQPSNPKSISKTTYGNSHILMVTNHTLKRAKSAGVGRPATNLNIKAYVNLSEYYTTLNNRFIFQ